MARPGRADRPVQLLRNVTLLARTALRHAAEDPLLLVVQSARRLPSRWREPLSRALSRGTSHTSPGLRRAFAEFVADRPAQAAAAITTGPEPRGTLAKRLRAELAGHLGLPMPPDAPPQARAREAWDRGDIAGAIRTADGHRSSRPFAARLAAERETMLPGFRLSLGEQVGASELRPGTNRLRVLHVLTNSVPHTQSGYALRSHAILRAQRASGIDARAVTRIGYPVTVGLIGAQSCDVVDSVPYHRVLTGRLADLPTTRLQQMVDDVLPMARSFRPDVLHTTTNFTNGLVTEALARALRVPWVYEVRGLLEETWLASRPAGTRAAAGASERFHLLRAKETELMLAADHVVVLSEVSRRQLVARGVPDERITTVPNAVDDATLARPLNPAEARERLGLGRRGFWVGSVSSLVDYEGFDVLLEAVALLRADGRDVRVSLAGDGVSRPALAQRASDLGIVEAVELPGRVPASDAWLWHRALDVFAVPRRDLQVCREVTPLKPVEAMAAGRPVIASDLEALQEIVGSPGSGVMVEPERPALLARAIARLMDEPGLRARYGDAGRAFAATRTWQRNVGIYRKVYQHVGVTA